MKTQAARATGRTGEAPDTFQGLRPNSSNNITKIFRSGTFSRFFHQDVSRLFENLSFEPIQIGATTSGQMLDYIIKVQKALYDSKI